MNRREILRYTSWITGAAVGAPLLGAVLSGCRAEPPTIEGGPLQLFTPEDFGLLEELLDTILPATDSPSATAVGVPRTIDHMIGYVYTEPARKQFQDRFAALAGHLRAAGFEKESESGKLDILNTLQASADSALDPVRKAFLDVRQQSIGILSFDGGDWNQISELPAGTRCI